MMRSCRGETPTGTGSPFIIVLTLLIVFYIIFLPPADRAALLGDGSSGGDGVGDGSGNQGGVGVNTPSGTEFVFRGPGQLSELDRTEYLHDVGPFVLEGQSQAIEILRANDFIVEHSVFAQNSRNFDFVINDPARIDSPILTFDVKDRVGVLRITLNGKEVFSGTIDGVHSQPLRIDPSQLDVTNHLVFEVSAPGFAFWDANRYQISQLKITADQVDNSRLSAKQLIEVRPVEVQNLISARLRFIPDCQTNAVGTLQIKIDGKEIYSQIPDCGQANLVALPKDLLKPGENLVEFKAQYGRYLLDRVQVQTYLSDEKGVTYYFDMDRGYFLRQDQKDPICGESDGMCPDSCDADVDRDCCFTKYNKGFWCEVPTQLVSDRCVGAIDNATILRCPSMYKDSSGSIPSEFQSKYVCGDNNDNRCPSGCNKYYDKDCCFVESKYNYWCDQLPIGGVINKCRRELTIDEARLCSSGYKSASSTLSVPKDPASVDDKTVWLLSTYRVMAEFTFVDDGNDHTAELVINGYKTNVDTTGAKEFKDISRYVVDNGNYIKIIPQSDFSLVQVRVSVERR